MKKINSLLLETETTTFTLLCVQCSTVAAICLSTFLAISVCVFWECSLMAMAANVKHFFSFR